MSGDDPRGGEEFNTGSSADDPKKQRSRRGWIIGGTVAGAVVLVAVIAAVAVSAGPAPAERAASTPSSSAPVGDVVAVPDLVGMTVAEAQTVVDDVGLLLTVPGGTDLQDVVATQTPSLDQEVAPGTQVVVTVEVDVPAVALGFTDGAALDPLTAVGWKFSLGGDGASWSPSPDAGEGDVIFVNDEGTCTAQYWQDAFDTAATDDLAATDEYLAGASGASADEMAQYAFDGHFALSGGLTGPDTTGEVATRTLLWSTDEGEFLMTARVFHALDYAQSTMSNAYLLQIQCDIGVNPQNVVDSLDEIAMVSVAQ